MTDANNNYPAMPGRTQAEPFLDCIARLLAKRWLRDQDKNSMQDGAGDPAARAFAPPINGNVTEE